MKRYILAVIVSVSLASTSCALAQTNAQITADIVENHILPGFDQLAKQSQTLAAVAVDHCGPDAPELRAAYSDAFDAWVAVSHLRFGPTEVGDRAFALAFWPDTRGFTPQTLSGLITAQDPIGQSAETYAESSIAGRGFYALEFLIYDDAIAHLGSDAYRCGLVQAITGDIANVATAIDADWHDRYAQVLLNPSEAGKYRSTEEAAQELFKALSTGLEFTGDTRLGRPLGTFDRPRPTRAEVWRSGRSARHVTVSLDALRDIALRLAGDDERLVARLNDVFDRSEDRLAHLNDPDFAAVTDVNGRFKLEVLQQSISDIRTLVRDEVGPKLGVVAGFNALDGD